MTYQNHEPIFPSLVLVEDYGWRSLTTADEHYPVLFLTASSFFMMVGQGDWSKFTAHLPLKSEVSHFKAISLLCKMNDYACPFPFSHQGKNSSKSHLFIRWFQELDEVLGSKGRWTKMFISTLSSKLPLGANRTLFARQNCGESVRCTPHSCPTQEKRELVCLHIEPCYSLAEPCSQVCEFPLTSFLPRMQAM